MVTFYVHHIIKEGHETEGSKIVNQVTEWTRNQPGLIFRQVLRSQKTPKQLDTVASWQSIEHYKAYMKTRPVRTEKDVEEEMKHFEVMTATMFDVEDSINL